MDLKKWIAGLLLVCMVGCSAEDVRNDGDRTAEQEEYIKELDAEIDEAEGAQ